MNTGIMTGGQFVRAQFERLVQKRLELDFLVAQNIGIGRTPRLVLLQEIGKDLVPVLFR